MEKSTNEVASATPEKVMPEKATRRERVNFSQARKKLDGITLKKDPKHWVLRWVNDDGDNIQDKLNRGYVFVEKDEVEGSVGDREVHGGNSDLNNRISRIVTKDRANPIRGYLMKIPKEFYTEDLKLKEAENAKVDEAIRAGQSGGASVANQYGDVSVTRRQ